MHEDFSIEIEPKQADIILIRGLFRGKYHWGQFPQQLQTEFPHKNILCVDIPGNGEQASEISPCSIEGMVESLRSQLIMNTAIDIISVSMGGMIGLKWAEQYPNEVNHLVCINTSAKRFSPFYQRLLPQSYLKIIKALLARPALRETIINSLISNREISSELIHKWVLLDKRYPMKRVNFFRQLIAALQFTISPPDCQLLFISSIQDHLVSYKATQAIALQWQSKLIYNQQDGHDIPLDNPKWLCEQLGPWLRDK
jgi:pimeloyl-ACP methyl ester carboxylesterase